MSHECDWPAAARHPQIVRTLIEGGADVHARTEVTSELVYTGFRYITAPPANTAGIIVEVKNPLGVARSAETISLPLSEVQKFLPSLQVPKAVVQTA